MSLIEGIWAENENDNALFWIKNDSIHYLENFDNPIPFEISDNLLIIGQDNKVNCEILKLSNDSLIYIDEYTNKITRLYKRTEE